MGVVCGKISFHSTASPYQLFLDHCQSHNVSVNEADPEFDFIDTQVIPELHVLRADGFEISGVGRCELGQVSAELRTASW